MKSIKLFIAVMLLLSTAPSTALAAEQKRDTKSPGADAAERRVCEKHGRASQKNRERTGQINDHGRRHDRRSAKEMSQNLEEETKQKLASQKLKGAYDMTKSTLNEEVGYRDAGAADEFYYGDG